MVKRTPGDLESIRETAVKLAVDFCSLSRRILRYANRGTPRADFLRAVSGMILDFSGADALELRMTDGELRYIWQSGAGETDRRCRTLERVPVHPELNLPCEEGGGLVEELCAALISGEFSRDGSNITRGGSLWIADSRGSAACPPLRDELGADELDEICGGAGSALLIPFHLNGRDTGLLTLKSERAGFLSPREVEFYEGLAETLGVAVTDRRAQHALRERMKELTCLYGIAKLVQRPGIPTDELLRGVVELLPPAWQYPELASARLVLDERNYHSRDYREGGAGLRAAITVEGRERGFIEVTYAGGEQYLEAALFLEEERSLIDGVAQQLSLILERRRTEEEKRRLQEQLRHADRLATIGQLAAGVAHELNEPLTSILGFAQLSQKHPELPTEAGEDLELIVKSTLHAREIVKKLLFFSRQMPSQSRPVDLNQTIEEGLYFLESRCRRQGIELVRELDPELPEITADPAQLHQVLVNLVVNAVQAMPGGGRLTISTRAIDEGVQLSVADEGIGMVDEVREKIFLPFFTTKDIGEGTGLGLPVVYGIVTAHGGAIEVDSAPERGSTFTITLPRRNTAERAPSSLEADK
jgi:signal transduction histidine kinase